jgi:hypothetical protein
MFAKVFAPYSNSRGQPQPFERLPTPLHAGLLSWISAYAGVEGGSYA